MARPCRTQCAKVFLIFFNFIFLLCGVVLIALGIWLQIEGELDEYLEVIRGTDAGPLLSRVSFILIGVGCFVTLLSFLGCCGACAESVCFLCMFTLFLFAVLLTEMSLAIYLGVDHKNIRSRLKENMKIQIRYNYTYKLTPENKTMPITLAWNYIQVKLECCGADGPMNYHMSDWYNRTRVNQPGVAVPATCCVLSSRDHRYPLPKEENQCQIDAALIRDQPDNRYLHIDGCHEALEQFALKNLHFAIMVVVGIVLLQLLDVIFACVLMARIRREHNKYPVYEHDDD